MMVSMPCRAFVFAMGLWPLTQQSVGQSLEEQELLLGRLISIRMKGNGLRSDPNPLWVRTKWTHKDDIPYKSVRAEADRILSDPTYVDLEGKWALKARMAFKIWMKDLENPQKLFTASTYLQLARTVDPSFRQARDFDKMYWHLNPGWSILLTCPESYEFARRAYIFNAGDKHYHKYRDLSLRLLQRNPYDRSVVIAMVAEHGERKFPREYEEKLFSSLEAISKRPDWRPWDHWTWGRAFRTYGHLHRKKEAYDTAIAKAEIALKNTPKGWDPAPLKKWIAETKKERDDPNFGWLPGAKHIDDLDPY